MGCIDSVQDYVSSVVNFAIAENQKDDARLSPAKQAEATKMAQMSLVDVRDYRTAMRAACPADISAAATGLQKPLVGYGVERSRAFLKAAAKGSEQLFPLPAGIPEVATGKTVDALLALEPDASIAALRTVLTSKS